MGVLYDHVSQSTSQRYLVSRYYQVSGTLLTTEKTGHRGMSYRVMNLLYLAEIGRAKNPAERRLPRLVHVLGTVTLSARLTPLRVQSAMLTWYTALNHNYFCRHQFVKDVESICQASNANYTWLHRANPTACERDSSGVTKGSAHQVPFQTTTVRNLPKGQ